MQQFYDAVLSPTGDAIVGATVTVTKLPSGTPTLYSDNGVTALGSNVLTTNSRGEYSFYAANGRYLCTITATGYSASTRDVVLQDPADQLAYMDDMGAAGNGVADDSAVLVAAQATTKPVVFTSGKTYYITPQAFTSDVDWRATGNEVATVYCDTTPASPMVNISGTTVGTTTVAAAAYPLDYVVQLTSTASVQVGDLLRFKNSTLWQSDDRGVTYEGQLCRVFEISGSNVYLDATLCVGMPIGAEVTIYRPVRVRMRNIRFQRLKINGSSVGVTVQAADEPVLMNCEVVNASRRGLHFLRCYKGKVMGGQYNGANLVVSTQQGYGILLEEAWANEVRVASFKENRRSIDITGSSGIPSWYCTVDGNQAYGGGKAEDGTTDLWPIGSEGGSGFGSHGGAVGTVYSNNICFNTFRGFTIRGRDETIRNNIIVGAVLTPIWCQHGGGLLVQDNRYTDTYEEGLATPGTSIGAISETRRPDSMIYLIPTNYDVEKHLTVAGNTARNVKRGLIDVYGATDAIIENWIVNNNTVVISPLSTGIVGILNRDNAVIAKNFHAWDNKVIAPDACTVLPYRIPYNPAVSEAEVFQINEKVWRLYVPDDKAARIRIGQVIGQLVMRMFPASNNTTPIFHGILRYESATTVNFGGTTGVTVATTALTGTTGSDGAWTVSFAADSVYVENRSGSAGQLTVSIDGAA